MITLLEQLVDRASGTYADRQDINKLEHLMFSWSERKEAYLHVQSKEDSIVDRAMSLMQSHDDFLARDLDESTLNLCRRDITLALRYYALGMLLQDEEMLKDRFLYWQKNVLQAMGLHHYEGVKFVLKSLYQELPKEQADLFKPYFKFGHEMISNN